MEKLQKGTSEVMWQQSTSTIQYKYLINYLRLERDKRMLVKKYRTNRNMDRSIWSDISIKAIVSIIMHVVWSTVSPSGKSSWNISFVDKLYNLFLSKVQLFLQHTQTLDKMLYFICIKALFDLHIPYTSVLLGNNVYSYWIAQWFKSLASKPEDGNLIPLWPSFRLHFRCWAFDSSLALL